MIEWLASGIPAAVEASGPRFLPTVIQLLLFGGATAAAGLFFGRFWLTRIIQNKDAELASEARRYEAQSERLSFYSDQITKLKEDIENAQNLEEAKEAVKEISETADPKTDFEQIHLFNRRFIRNKINRFISEHNLTLPQIAIESNINQKSLYRFMDGKSISRTDFDRLIVYATNKDIALTRKKSQTENTPPHP